MSKKIIPKKADPVTPRVPFVQMCENVFFLKCPTVLLACACGTAAQASAECGKSAIL